jgi:DNA-directed RNA polymerase subunit M/transcription elongation factor TFIIS
MMKCKKCHGILEVHRVCRGISMRCRQCNSRFQISEVVDQLDEETELLLEKYNVIVYD